MKLKRISLILCVLIMSMVSFQQVSFAAEGEPRWVEKKSMATARYHMSGMAYDGKIYIHGGSPGGMGNHFNTMEIYDPSTNQWTTGPSSPLSRHSAGSTEFQGKLYVFGGTTGTKFLNDVEIFDPKLNIWTTQSSIPTGYRDVHVVPINNEIYLFGGTNKNNDPMNLVYSFDPIKNTWTQKNNTNFSKNVSASFVYNDALYIISGDIIYEYDYTQDTWLENAQISEHINHAFNYKGNIIFASAYNLFLYDINTKSLNPLPNAQHTLTGNHQMHIVNDKLYLIGGNQGANILSKTYEYDLSQLSPVDPEPNPEPEPEPTGKGPF